jgi:hypothetical protein
MSAPLPMGAGRIPVTRTGLLAGASAVLATASVAVTLAVSTGGDAAEAPAAPRDLPAIETSSQPIVPSAAEQFHHFR